MFHLIAPDTLMSGGLPLKSINMIWQISPCPPTPILWIMPGRLNLQIWPLKKNVLQSQQASREFQCFHISYHYSSLSHSLFMHLIFENLIKNLVLLWMGNFKDLDEGCGDYVLSPWVWEAIGEATAASGSTIPSAYGVWHQNVAQDKSQISADSQYFTLPHTFHWTPAMSHLVTHLTTWTPQTHGLWWTLFHYMLQY